MLNVIKGLQYMKQVHGSDIFFVSAKDLAKAPKTMNKIRFHVQSPVFCVFPSVSWGGIGSR